MRIISGKFGGRKINPPSKMPHTRPTTDIAKEGLFNILQNRISFDQIKTLDLFGGTGSISYELASRGASHLTIVEKDAVMYNFIKNNIAQLKIENCQVFKLDIFNFLATCTEKYDFIFAGPPYALGSIDEIPKIIMQKQLLAPNGYFVLEHTPRNNYETFTGFSFVRNYGTTLFSFFIAE
ncbi:MAG TPA: 16S rRNA (guanine(966)-N(2))-methyltransferase RsmD [Chitinophagaceae bacterium]|nr:16S rRNA (guanine(966)-N(2))-methyltransferase RsmD [Chitinophagaceae bacterium]MCC6634904.1 16S rRNA (guanine(966)-N(2))-methyltransferase RsmD [Chitinophagaceae bacterium]HMZ47323.1 16S rRNA (guanine(966)-N(2))-methyltransferase RsmD [Chitinophagaceae bacterium]HNE94279.1 16S rRNA (guanine(966)-N(2))-methyltransferase RsmD [Chitinophagaceae bacterium]HNF30048.1 16S rRNA (guanine(966)-N(2))-methyltransferase RsmD [Chitinophagaceae bacterium]